MVIFTWAATALVATFFGYGAIAALGTVGIGAIALGLAIGTNIGLNYVVAALSGNERPQSETMGTQGQLAASGAVPRAFGVGYHMTAGSLVYANTWASGPEQTPNGYLSQVIALSDLPGEKLLEFWCNGERCTLSLPVTPNTGAWIPLPEYNRAGIDHLWISYYDGHQTVADGTMTTLVSSDERPYHADRIGTGICYAIVHAALPKQDDDDQLFSGFPAFKFALTGIPLYDPSKDSTAGGVGPQRYSDPSTWGGDGDQLPAVQAYNILRGIRYNGGWFYGLQNMAPARLPAANWIAQIAKCRATVTGETGAEPTYRAGGQINIDSQPANAIEAILTACQGRLCEIGGSYKIYLGAPDLAVKSFTDADLLSSEQQIYRPFFSLDDSVNGIAGTYPDPAQGWETATAPPLYRTDLEAHDGNRRLMASPQFNFVPYRAQVQRLQKSGIEEAQRARTHVIPLPPAYWAIEPGDIVNWNSARNGYADKLFRVDSVVDRANLDIALNITEIDPADYDWDHASEFVPVVTGPTIIPRPPPQGVLDWFAEGVSLYDADGLSRRPAIRITWDGTLPGIAGIQYEVRLASDGSHVTNGRTDQYSAGALIISQGIIPLTSYQVRGQFIPLVPRAMLWSDWLTVTTPAVISDNLPAEIVVQVTRVMDYLSDRVIELEQRLSTVQSKLAAQDYEVFRDTRRQFVAQHGVAMAAIETIETVATDASEAVADLETSVTAQFAETNANVTTNATAIASIEGWGAANYAVTLTVDGYATGFELLNGGVGFSTTTFVQEKFQVAAPGVGGGAPVPIFTVANVGGSPKVALRGDMYVDGTIAGIALIADTITAREIAADTITTNEIAANTILAGDIKAGEITSASGVIGALGVNSLSIADNAVTVPVAQTLASNVGAIGSPLNYFSFNLSINTAGLLGKVIPVYVMLSAQWENDNSSTAGGSVSLLINGSVVNGYGLSNPGGGQISLVIQSGVVNITGNNATITVPIVAQMNMPVGSGINAGATIFAMAAKR